MNDPTVCGHFHKFLRSLYEHTVAKHSLMVIKLDLHCISAVYLHFIAKVSCVFTSSVQC